MKSLLLWIVQPDELDDAVAKIKEVWKPSGNIFILTQKLNIPISEFYLVWNTEYHFRYAGVIKLNRKGTTYFTIDALNALSIEANGKIDKDWSPDWDEYKYTILLSDKDGGCNKIKTGIYDIVKL